MRQKNPYQPCLSAPGFEPEPDPAGTAGAALHAPAADVVVAVAHAPVDCDVVERVVAVAVVADVADAAAGIGLWASEKTGGKLGTYYSFGKRGVLWTFGCLRDWVSILSERWFGNVDRTAILRTLREF